MQEQAPSVAFQKGSASWYGHPFHGRKAANGSRYNMYEMTAAHRNLPFGSRVLVRSLATGRTVEVVITDRGPYHGDRVIDLSYAAAERLGIAHQGIDTVLLSYR